MDGPLVSGLSKCKSFFDTFERIFWSQRNLVKLKDMKTKKSSTLIPSSWHFCKLKNHFNECTMLPTK